MNPQVGHLLPLPAATGVLTGVAVPLPAAGHAAQQQIRQRKPGGIGDAALLGAVVAQAHLLHLPLDELGQEDGGLFVAEVTFHDLRKTIIQANGVPVLMASSWKASRKRAVKGPGLPVPMMRRSSATTGMTSAAVPVRKHSSAVKMS